MCEVVYRGVEWDWGWVVWSWVVCGAVWCGVVWCGVARVVRCGAVWLGVECCCEVWCVCWRGVMWSGVGWTGWDTDEEGGDRRGLGYGGLCLGVAHGGEYGVSGDWDGTETMRRSRAGWGLHGRMGGLMVRG